ncbi:unnamed protein product [Dracunculus medinensis]|uniref:ShKT domain-containing protein n=1 Tax=Dracunculus medinensis TaxID=318479 RepID=A0A0N4UQP1_DRAME|nr:unnamed protein product [Dracunculus medinensis]
MVHLLCHQTAFCTSQTKCFVGLFSVASSTTAASANRCADYRTNCFQYAPFCTNPRYREVLSRYCPLTCNIYLLCTVNPFTMMNW